MCFGVCKRLVIRILIGYLVILTGSCTNEGPRQSVEAAAAEYLAALADGTFDGYLAHEKGQRQLEVSEKQKYPSDQWIQRQGSLRAEAKARLTQINLKSPHRGGNDCYSFVTKGASVVVKEIRPVNPIQWRVFYEVTYSQPDGSPEIELVGSKRRFLRSSTFSVDFEKPPEEKIPLADYRCIAVGGSASFWPVPSLPAEEAMRRALQSNLVPTRLPIEISGVVGVSSDRSWGSWNEFIEAGDMLKSFLEKHGWVVRGFEKPSVGYYSYGGEIEPPPSHRQWVIGAIPNPLVGQGPGYNVVFLEKAESSQSDFSAQEDNAVLTLRTKFSGCTPFCELWKDVRTMPFIVGNALFFGAFGRYNTAFDFDAVTMTTIKFAWTPSNGWQVIQ